MQHSSEWKLTSPGGVPYKLIRQSGSFGCEDASWNMEICIRSHDLTAFIAECFPAPYVSGSFVIYPKRFYPAGLPSLECKTVNVEGFTSGKPIDPFGVGISLYSPEEYVATYEPYLRLTLAFGPCPSNDQEQDTSNPFTWLEVTANESGEFLTSDIDQEKIRWQDEDGNTELPSEEDTQLSQPVKTVGTEWTCRWPQIPFDFFQDTLVPRMRAVEGQVNDAPMELFANAPAETILFLGFQNSYEYTWREGRSGTSPVQATLRFAEKNFIGRQMVIDPVFSFWQDVQVTHNHIWRPNHGWQRMLIGTEPLYKSGNLNSIFTG